MCGNWQFETKGKTTTPGRECQDWRTCDYDTQYESSAPDGHNDRQCSALTTCDDVNAGGTQYESKAKTQYESAGWR